MSTLEIYGDGGARGNPGPAASAFVIFQDNEKLHEGSKFLGRETNNVAEYTCVLLALTWLHEHKKDFKGKVIFYMDSELVVRQLSGIYKVKSEKLLPLYTKAKKLLTDFPQEILFMSVPRAKNSLADGLVNKSLDTHTS